jgi:hypothetical protein
VVIGNAVVKKASVLHVLSLRLGGRDRAKSGSLRRGWFEDATLMLILTLPDAVSVHM